MAVELIVRGDGVRRMRELGVQLRGTDKVLRLELQAAARAAALPIVNDVKAAVLAIPVTGGGGGGSFARAAAAKRTPKGGHGLRNTIASATGMQIRTTGRLSGVRIRINVSKLPPDQQSLPWALDSPTGWRHPVFGDSNVWVRQRGHPYFEVTIRKHHAAARAKVEAAMDVTLSKLL